MHAYPIEWTASQSLIGFQPRDSHFEVRTIVSFVKKYGEKDKGPEEKVGCYPNVIHVNSDLEMMPVWQRWVWWIRETRFCRRHVRYLSRSLLLATFQVQ